jgi:GNAT superfamily N-acetyltransferase
MGRVKTTRPTNLIIQPLFDPTLLVALAQEAQAHGHRMVQRLIDEWIAGENRFEKPGERSFIATLDGQICGVCGLNIDPFAGDKSVGRVRRLYVSASARRRGIASAIMEQLVKDAHGTFRELRLRTLDPGASAFYQAIGFTPVHGIENCTHRQIFAEK